MRRYLTHFVVLLLMLSMVIVYSGCTEDESGEVFTTGEIVVNVDGAQYVMNDMLKCYYNTVHETLDMSGNQKENVHNSVSISIKGNQAGQYVTNPDSGAIVGETYMKLSLENISFWYDSADTGASVTFTISEFGEVGGNIIGEFSGMLIHDETTNQQPPINVTGSFNIVREDNL